MKSMPTCHCHEFIAPLLSHVDVIARCKTSTVALRRTFDLVRMLPSGWVSLFRCRECGSLWCEEYPFGEWQGGGPRCIYRIELLDIEDWTRTFQAITPGFRQQYEDSEFLQSLSEEVGPELCQHPNCGRLQIHNSIMCRRHHFEMITYRQCPQ